MSISNGIKSAMKRPSFLIAFVILLLAGAVPAWPHARSWGYAPSGLLGLVLLILLILLLLQVIPWR